jgi:hypothetical protein
MIAATVRRFAAVLLPLLVHACGGAPSTPPTDVGQLKGPDGAVYLLLDRGPYKAFYDPWGRLLRIEYDANGDGAPDQFAHHQGRKRPVRIEIDTDFDGRLDRWEHYDDEGRLHRIGATRRAGAPDTWVELDAAGAPLRREYDDDGDGRVERAELLEGEAVAAIALDTDRDGRFDRWQHRRGPHAGSEDLDTDGDGRPDRRLVKDARGRLLRAEALK